MRANRRIVVGLTAAAVIAVVAPAASYAQTARPVDQSTKALQDKPDRELATLDGKPVSLRVATASGNACATTADNVLACQSNATIEAVNREALEALKAGKVPPGSLAMPPKEMVDRILGVEAAVRATTGKRKLTRAAASCGGRSDTHLWTGGHFNDSWWHGGYVHRSYWSLPGTGGGTWNNSVTSYKTSQYYWTSFWDGGARNGDYYGGGWDSCSEAHSLATGNPAWNNRFSSMELLRQN